MALICREEPRVQDRRTSEWNRQESGRQAETSPLDLVAPSSPCGVISTTGIAVIKLIHISASRPYFGGCLTNCVLTRQTFWSFKERVFLAVSETVLTPSSIMRVSFQRGALDAVLCLPHFQASYDWKEREKIGMRAHVRICMYTHTHTYHVRASKQQIMNTVKEYYKVAEGNCWCHGSQMREAETSSSVSAVSEGEETKICPCFPVSWGQVTLEPDGYQSSESQWSCANPGVQRSLRSFGFLNRRSSGYKRTFWLRLILENLISLSGLR